MVMVLLMLFGSESNEKQDNNKIVYHFKKNKVKKIPIMGDEEGDEGIKLEEKSVLDVVGMVLAGAANKILFTYASYWQAEQTWQANLRHYHIHKAK